MKVSITLRHGPVDIDIEADSTDDYQKELEEIVGFLQEKEDDLMSLSPPQPSVSSPPGDGSQELAANGSSAAPPISDPDSPLAPVAEDLHVSTEQLEEIMDVDPESERHPILFLPDTDILGDLKVDRQRKGSIILLYLWKKCYGKEKVPSSELSKALDDSDISSTNMFHMYDDEGKRYFNQTGKGGSSRVELRRPGEKQAIEEIERLLESFEEDE